MKPCHEDIYKDLPTSSLVVLEDVEESITHEMLMLLVENVTWPSGGNYFQIELIREKKVAVLTFQQNNGMKYKVDVIQILHFENSM